MIACVLFKITQFACLEECDILVLVTIMYMYIYVFDVKGHLRFILVYHEPQNGILQHG